MSLDIFLAFLCSIQCASDSSLYRINTPNKMIIAVCHTIQTAGRLRRTLVFFWRSHSSLKLWTQPILFGWFCFFYFCLFLFSFLRCKNCWTVELFRCDVFCKKDKHFKGPEHLKFKWAGWAKMGVCFNMRTLPQVTPSTLNLECTWLLSGEDMCLVDL